MGKLSNIYPVRNCEHELNKDLVTVLYKKKKLGLIERTFFKKQSEKPYKIDLDEIGSYIWLQIDGKKSVGKLTELAKNHFLNKIDPAEERVELFINQMHKNKLISLFEKKEN
jgi:hypothetical protein